MNRLNTPPPGLRAVMMGCAFLALSAPAQAGDPRSEAATAEGATYLKLEGGYVLGFDSDVTGGPASTVDVDGSWAVDGAAGYYFLPKTRAEVSVGYTSQDVLGASGGFAAAGDLNALTAFTSIYRDFTPFQNIRPFVGFGVGLARLTPDYTLAGMGGAGPSDSDVKFAWQGTTGIAADLTDTVAIETRYRYISAGDYDFGPSGEGEFANHAFLAGLRYTLGGQRSSPRQDLPPVRTAQPEPQPAPPPAPAPTPPPPPAPEVPDRELLELVFFDFNSSSLNAEADKVLDAAAIVIRQRNVKSIILEGHTDSSGNPAYNLRLSRARAEAVRAGLISRGVPDRNITLQPKGESALRLTTADGVKSQVNRFVRIIAEFDS